MRLVSAFLLVALTGSVTLAEDAKPSTSPDAAQAKPADAKPEAHRKVPLRVVKMLPETHQVLLFDKSRGTHVVAEAGQDVGGYLVEEIDDDEVTLVTQNGAEVILTAPETSWRKHDRKKAAADTAMVDGATGSTAATAPSTATTAPSTAPSTAATAPSAASSSTAASSAAAAAAGPLDPYADAPAAPATATTAAPIVAGEGGVRVATATPGASATSAAAPAVSTAAAGSTGAAAPAVAASSGVAGATAAAAGPADPYGDPGIDAFANAVGATPAPAKPSPNAKVDAAGSLAAAATGTPAVSVAAPAAFTVTRHDVDAALADFGATAVTFDATFSSDGLRFDHIAKGTILAKLGLQAGDILTAVDNQPLHSLDDAASLYARAGTAKGAKLHVLRAGAPLTVAVVIR